MVAQEAVHIAEQRLTFVNRVKLDLDIDQRAVAQSAFRAPEDIELRALGVELDGIDTVDLLFREDRIERPQRQFDGA